MRLITSEDKREKTAVAVETLGRFDSGPRETFYQIAQQTVAENICPLSEVKHTNSLFEVSVKHRYALVLDFFYML